MLPFFVTCSYLFHNTMLGKITYLVRGPFALGFFLQILAPGLATNLRCTPCYCHNDKQYHRNSQKASIDVPQRRFLLLTVYLLCSIHQHEYKNAILNK